jgi:hypothetical protein
MARSIYDLSPQMFARRGVRLVFLDVDNTLMPYDEDTAPQPLLDWCAAMREGGLELFILSNNHGERPAIFSRQLGIDFIGRAHKPSAKRLREICNLKGIPTHECALVGDQIYTDVLCAKNAGAAAFLVRPIKFTNPLLALRYGLEAPFRLAGKMKKGEHNG